MPPVKDVKRLSQKPRSKSTDNTRIVELRKERSRDAARTRRGKENAQFDELAKLLPLPSAIASQLDKASIVRLTISYLDMKQFVRKARRERPHSDTSLFSESSASPMSECGTDRLTGSPGSPSPNSSVSSPPMSAGAVVSYHLTDTSTSGDFGSDSGLHLLQALDGFLFVLSNEGKVLYVSETVSVHLGLSQVELTGSSMYGYLHPDDHDDLARILNEATQDLENSEVGSSTSGLFDNEIPFFGQQQGTIFASGHKTPAKEKPKSFFLRMKCTLVRRGGAYTKSSGFKVIHCMGRMKKYTATDLSPPKYAFVAMGQPLPTMNINELPLECNMFVSRVNMDLRIVYCEGRIHKFMDYFARDIVGISAYDFYHANDIAIIQTHHAKFLSKGQVLTKYYRWMNKNGGWVWLQTKASLIPHPTNPELKQMLCLNYIVSDVEHRGVVLGMAQLENKPNLHRPGAYITEVENESDTSGQNLKDAQFDDQVMVYPKWHETSDNLVPKPTLLDALALTRTGYDVKTTGLDTNMLENDVFSTAPSTQWPQASTAVTMSRGSGDSSKGQTLATSCGSTSTVDDELEDITEIIDAEMSDLDREFVAYVLSGSEAPMTAQPNLGTSTVSQENVVSGMIPPKDQISLNSGVPKIEEVSMDGLEDVTPVAGSTCSVKDPGLSPQVFGSLPVGGFPSDTKAGVVPLNQETDLLELTFTTESSKLRVTNSPCMFSNVRATNTASRGPFSNYVDQPMPTNAPLAVPHTGNVMKMPSVTPSRSVTFTSQSRPFGGPPLQKREVTSTVTSVPGSFHSPSDNSCTGVQSDEQMRFLQELKSSFPSENSFSEDFLVNLVDEMMQDAEAQRRKDEKLALCLQQGGYQMEGIVKQEVVTPTMAQPTSLFTSFFNTLARQENQPSGVHRQVARRVNSYGSNQTLPTTCTNTMPQCQRTQSLPGSTLRRQENGATRVPNNHHVQFTRQEDSNMNFLNSLSNGRIGTNNMQAPLQRNPPSNRLPKQQPHPMQQAIRDILQNTNNTTSKQTANLAPQLNSNMVSRQHVGTIPQQNYVTLPQTAPVRNQSNVFNNMTVNPTMNQLDFVQLDQISSPLHTVPQQNSGYRNLNGSGMPTIHQLDHTFDFCENL